jgi:hypothetical protein
LREISLSSLFHTLFPFILPPTPTLTLAVQQLPIFYFIAFRTEIFPFPIASQARIIAPLTKPFVFKIAILTNAAPPMKHPMHGTIATITTPRVFIPASQTGWIAGIASKEGIEIGAWIAQTDVVFEVHVMLVAACAVFWALPFASPASTPA